MKTLADFLDMGGYGAYVWGSYGICTAVMVWNLLQARKQAQLIRQRIRQRLQQKEQGT